MMIIINLLILVFLILMVVYWGTQGLFSALLHLCVTIVAIAVAISIWEPIAYLVMDLKPAVAWTVGLLLPFGLLLFGFRWLMDRYVPGNMAFAPLVDFIGGGALGLIAGVYTAGLVMLGTGFLPASAMIYMPLSVTESGQVQEGGDALWIPVDQWTFATFSELSAGAFRSSTPLAYYNPALPRQAALVRLTFDPQASGVAIPDSVTIDKVYAQQTPVAELSPAVALELGEGFKQRTNQLLVVDTSWDPGVGDGTYDAVDNTARVPPSQIRLVTQTTTGSRIDNVYVHAPLAATQESSAGERIFRPFNQDDVFAFSTRKENLGWVFVVPQDQEPKYLLVRNTRVAMPGSTEFVEDVAALEQVLGEPIAEQGEDQAGIAGASAEDSAARFATAAEGSQLPEGFELTNRLPTAISANRATSLTYQDNAILSGSATTSESPGSLSQRIRIDSIFAPAHKRMVRVRMDANEAQSLLGRARASAQRLGGIWLKDSRGNEWVPHAYVLKKGNEQQIRVGDEIRTARDLPVVGSGSELYLYFLVDPGIELTGYHVAGTDLNLNARVE